MDKLLSDVLAIIRSYDVFCMILLMHDGKAAFQHSHLHSSPNPEDYFATKAQVKELQDKVNDVLKPNKISYSMTIMTRDGLSSRQSYWKDEPK